MLSFRSTIPVHQLEEFCTISKYISSYTFRDYNNGMICTCTLYTRPHPHNKNSKVGYVVTSKMMFVPTTDRNVAKEELAKKLLKSLNLIQLITPSVIEGNKSPYTPTDNRSWVEVLKDKNVAKIEKTACWADSDPEETIDG